MDLNIRLATADDLPQILALQTRSLRELSAQTYNAAQTEALIKSQNKARTVSFNLGNEAVYVAYLETASSTAGEKMVAIAALIPDCAQIGGLYVEPDYARQGVATQLLTHLETIATAQQMHALKVISSLVAVPFYEAMGYSRLFSRMVRFEGEMVGCIEMTKALGDQDFPSALTTELNRQVAWTLAPLLIVVVAVWIASS